MLRIRPAGPGRGFVAGIKSPTMEQALEIKYSLRKAKYSLCWGLLNVILLSIIIYDLAYKCPFYTTTFNYIEYGLAVIFTLNVLYHIVRYFFLMVNLEPVNVSASDRRMISAIKDEMHPLTATQSTSTTSVLTHIQARTPERNQSGVFNNSGYNTSWRSETQNDSKLWRTTSPNESQNYSISSPSWVYFRGSPDHHLTSTPPARHTFSGDHSTPLNEDTERISNEKMLKQYLYDYEVQEKVQNASSNSEQQSNLLSTFWAHPITQTQHEVSMYLRKNQYQLSTSSPSATTSNASGVKDEGSPLNVAQRGNEVWKKLQVDPQTLTQWNANLRMWISQTILERLSTEIDSLNIAFQHHHLQDVQIGYVGLDRLRKTAQTTQAMEYFPTLSSLLPFLEASSNQQYLVKRIRELGKGGCMSQFKWQSGGSFGGKEWDDNLPTDSAIIMHVLSTYLDSQLLPLPSQPDARPFSKEHYIKMNEKIPSSTLTLAINQVSEKPPYYRLIVGEDVFEVAKGHNNLFHTVLLFLYYVNQKEQGMLGKVNMGKSGVNMLWIIDR